MSNYIFTSTCKTLVTRSLATSVEASILMLMSPSFVGTTGK